MYGAFQSNAFQSSAFQIITSGNTPPVDTGDDHDLVRRHRDRLKRHAKAAEKAIYRNVIEVKPPTLEMDKPQEAVIQRPILTLPAAPSIHDMKRLPLANPNQWLIDDDEEAIFWLLQ